MPPMDERSCEDCTFYSSRMISSALDSRGGVSRFTILRDAVPEVGGGGGGGGDGGPLDGLSCSSCGLCVAVSRPRRKEERRRRRATRGRPLSTRQTVASRRRKWRRLETVLSSGDNSKSGWLRVEEDQRGDDFLRYRLLNSVCHRLNDPPDRSRFECLFSEADPGREEVRLLWSEGEAAGFATVREWGVKGGGKILDTLFIRRSHRGLGHARRLLSSLLLETSPNGLVGLSQPISNGMLAASIKVLASELPEARRRLWTVDQEGDGERKNLWWSAPTLAEERGVDLERLLKSSQSK